MFLGPPNQLCLVRSTLEEKAVFRRELKPQNSQNSFGENGEEGDVPCRFLPPAFICQDLPMSKPPRDWSHPDALQSGAWQWRKL